MQTKALHDDLMDWKPDIIIADESQRLKNPKAKRTKLAVMLADQAMYKYILSGTPILNNAMDIFSQFAFLDGGETFGRNFFVFRAKYFEDKNAGMPTQKYFPNWQPKFSTEKLINDMVYKKAFRVTKDECLDLPPLLRQNIEVELGQEQKKAYDELANDLITFINDKACTAPLAIVKSLRLQQVISGFYKAENDEGIGRQFAENPRLEALKELLELYADDHKIIIWACFRDNYVPIQLICTDLGLQHRVLVGGMTDKNREEAIQLFQNDPKIRVLIANQQAAGLGVNLTASDISIYYSRNFSLEADLQSEARNHRGGSERHKTITRIDLVASETIDEKILGSLKNKKNIAENILSFLKTNLLKKGN
jgi:SNF2 family DNA or RNA helicase